MDRGRALHLGYLFSTFVLLFGLQLGKLEDDCFGSSYWKNLFLISVKHDCRDWKMMFRLKVLSKEYPTLALHASISKSFGKAPFLAQMSEVYLGEFTKAIRHSCIILELTFCVYVTSDLDVLIEGWDYRWIIPNSNDYVNISDLSDSDSGD
ncbi:hypothetical protein CJ030_MR6G002435 [Morella rubra]|uniref:Uncharacterized protein n=1 Tax=Morella rubra TaxID=262757 RepID=A0A6A1VEL5_9ROSI|nr:hypothetical protein CJ030_MR6G002435 [Morella rubra]